jgi:hypothetical protein
MAWYDTLKEFLKTKGFKPGSFDPTLFTKSYDGELFVCQIYVDDIIFGCTNKKYSDEFAYMMREKYQLSMMGGAEIIPRTSNSSTTKWHLHFPGKVHQGLPEEIRHARLQRSQNSYADEWSTLH